MLYYVIIRGFFCNFAAVILLLMGKLNRIEVMLFEKEGSQKELAGGIGKSFSTANDYCCNRHQVCLDFPSQLKRFSFRNAII